jgi:hypothetical protein
MRRGSIPEGEEIGSEVDADLLIDPLVEPERVFWIRLDSTGEE